MMGHSRQLRLFSPAKLNLCLQILGKRDDGFHELLLLNTAIDLADEVCLETAEEDKIRVECDREDVPGGESNLAYRAAKAFFRRWPEARRGLRIRIQKRIPVAGGLGGGSSNAAAVLVALNLISGLAVPDEELRAVGSELGADVPFFLFQSPAIVQGKGEILRPAAPLPEWYYVIVPFPFGVSTAWAFAEWDLTNAPKSGILINLKGRNVAPSFFRNDLSAVVMARYSEVRRAQELLLRKGAAGAMMSGSGPTVFGVFAAEETAQQAAVELQKRAGLQPICARAVKGPVINGEKE